MLILRCTSAANPEPVSDPAPSAIVPEVVPSTLTTNESLVPLVRVVEEVMETPVARPFKLVPLNTDCPPAFSVFPSCCNWRKSCLTSCAPITRSEGPLVLLEN